MAVRVQVSKAPLNFPPYAMTLDPSKERILVAGGGGDSKTGVPNRIVAMKCKNGIIFEEQEYDTQKQAVMGVSTSADGMIIASVDDKCRLYAPAGGSELECVSEQVSEIKGRKDDRQVKKAKSAGNHVYSAGTDGVVRVWLSPSLDLLKEIPVLPKETADFDISTATRSGAPALLVSSREVCHVYRHDAWMAQPELLASLDCSAPYKFRNCRFSPDTRFIYTAEFMPQHGSLVKKWDTSTMSTIVSAKIRFNRDHHTTMGLSSQLCSSDGRFLAFGSAEGELRVLRTSDLSLLHSSKPHSFFVSDVLFYPSISPEFPRHIYIVTCAGDNTVACTTIDPSPPVGVLRTLLRGFFLLCAVSVLWNVTETYFAAQLAWLVSFFTPYIDLALQTILPVWEEHISPFLLPHIAAAFHFVEPHIISATFAVHPYLELLKLDPRFVWLQATLHHVSVEPIVASMRQIFDSFLNFASGSVRQEISGLLFVGWGWVAATGTCMLEYLQPLLIRVLDISCETLVFCIEFGKVYYDGLIQAARPAVALLLDKAGAVVEEIALGLGPIGIEYGAHLRQLAEHSGMLIAHSAEWLSSSITRAIS